MTTAVISRRILVRPDGPCMRSSTYFHQPTKATWANGVIAFANGRWLEGVGHDVWKFEVSGYAVLQRWLAAREHWILSN
jgi:hypothetical protein